MNLGDRYVVDKAHTTTHCARARNQNLGSDVPLSHIQNQKFRCCRQFGSKCDLFLFVTLVPPKDPLRSNAELVPFSISRNSSTPLRLHLCRQLLDLPPIRSLACNSIQEPADGCSPRRFALCKMQVKRGQRRTHVFSVSAFEPDEPRHQVRCAESARTHVLAVRSLQFPASAPVQLRRSRLPGLEPPLARSRSK